MATSKLWVVRSPLRTGNYYIFRGHPPRRIAHDWNTRLSNYMGYMNPVLFEGLFPSRQLPTGGGPVLIEFKETT